MDTGIQNVPLFKRFSAIMVERFAIVLQYSVRRSYSVLESETRVFYDV